MLGPVRTSLGPGITQDDLVRLVWQTLVEDRKVVGELLENRHIALLERIQRRMPMVMPRQPDDQPRSPQVEEEDEEEQEEREEEQQEYRVRLPDNNSIQPPERLEPEEAEEQQEHRVLFLDNSTHPPERLEPDEAEEQLSGQKPEPEPDKDTRGLFRSQGSKVSEFHGVTLAGDAASAPHLKRLHFVEQWLDVVAGVVILLNLCVAALHFQYISFDLACTLKAYAADCTASDQVWPHAKGIFEILEWVFGICFTVELLIRIVCRINLVSDFWWNVLDVVFVAAWLAERVALGLGFDPTMFRSLRLVRLFRLARLVKDFKILDPLFLILKAIQSSMSVLLWTVPLLLLMMMVIAMLNATLLQSFMEDTSQDDAARTAVFQSWGSFIRAFVSMFEVTLANWGPQCWLLMNNVHTSWGLFFIIWKCCFGFAVVQVITSVFIQHTFKVASRDEELMIKEKEKSTQHFLTNLDKLFIKMDETHDGIISRSEFEQSLSNPRVKHWFGALEIDVSDVPKIFDLLAQGDGQVTRDDFFSGVKKLKGTALSADLWSLARDVQRLTFVVKEIEASLCAL